MKVKKIYIDNLKGLKQAEKLQNLGYIPLHNGFFSPYLTLIKGTEEEIINYKNKYYSVTTSKHINYVANEYNYKLIKTYK